MEEFSTVEILLGSEAARAANFLGSWSNLGMNDVEKRRRVQELAAVS